MKSLKLLFVVFLLFAFGVFVSAQSRPQTSGGNGKSNKRPPAAETKPKPESTPAEDTSSSQSEPPADAIVDDEILKIDTDLVLIPVKVTDKSGRFIAGLKKEDFKVFDEGAEKEIAYFSNEEQPFTVVLMLDMSISTTFKINEIQSAAISFIVQLRPADQVMVVSFDEEVHMLSEVTKDRERIRAAIRSTSIASGTSLYEAVDMVINKRLRQMPGRKAIVLFTDGVDTTSRVATDTSNLRDAYELDALIYAIQYDTYADVQRAQRDPGVITGRNPIPSPIPGPGGSKLPIPLPLPKSNGTADKTGTTPEEYQKADEYLQQMALATSGRVYRATDKGNLALAFGKIADELRQTYSLGFYPDVSEEGKGKRRKLKVRTSRQGVSVSARDSYTYKKKSEKKKAK